MSSALILGMLLAPLVGCAPEPGTAGNGASGSDSTEIPQIDPKDKQEPEGGSWPEENPDEVFEKHQDLPADFPADFVVPAGAVIDDTGSRGFGTWFIVLRAADAAAADELWAQVIDAGGFTASDELETPEGGRAATLTSAALEVTAVTIPQTDGDVALSYDITALAS